MSGDRKAGRARRQDERHCPICGRPATLESLPFCSRRCADVDLNRWLSGGYAIPGPSADEEGGGDGGGSGQGGDEPI